MQRLPTYSTLGHGPMVLLLHGSGGCHRSFAPQLETLASLGFRAVAWDMPGYGHSPPIEPYGFKGLAERAAALIGALAPASGITPIAVVGQGLGGMLALELALRRPDLVCQLVLVATAAALEPGDGYSGHVAQALRWLDAGLDMTAIADTLVPRLLGPGALPEAARLANWCQGQVHGASWRRALQAMHDFDRRAALPHLHVPTLLVAGAHDRVTPPAAMQSLAAAIAGSRLATLEGAGHLPQLERADEFDALLVDFLRRARMRLH